jgi:hypothetical protein
MRGALLFLATIMIVTPGGRSNIGEFTARTSTLYDNAAPYSSMMLLLTAFMALVVALMLRRSRVGGNRMLIVRTEVSGPMFNGSSQRRQRKSRFSWLRRIPALIR